MATAQDKADVLKEHWEKASKFSDAELNTMGWKTSIAFYASNSEKKEAIKTYIKELNAIWKTYQEDGWDDDECKILMLGGEAAIRLVQNS